MSPFSINNDNTATNKCKSDLVIAMDQLNDFSSRILELCKNKDNTIKPYLVSDHIQSVLMNFLSVTPNDFDRASEHLELFISSSVPKSLVTLYMTHPYTKIAYICIREFIDSLKSNSLTPIYAFIILNFCNILREDVGTKDGLYCICRSNLGAMIESTGIARCKYGMKMLVSFNDVFPCLMEISAELSHDLDSTMGTTGYVGLSFTLVHDFTTFVHPMWNVLWLMDNDTHEAKFYKKIGLPLCKMFYDLLAKITWSLRLLGYNDKKGDVLIVPWWSLYLDILKDLHNKSKLYKDMENDFWRIMKQVKVSLCILIAKFAEELEHYDWLFEHKEVTNFYIRRKLAMMMLPKVEDDEHDQYYMLIDRSKLLVDSFEYIAKLKNMPGSFFVEFKEEQATGPGVLRAWFLLASQEIFNPKNGLFVACPDDIEDFSQIKGVLLEDIRDADPFLYRGCKEILNIDAKKVDQDVLGLTFVCEVESLGLRRETELCPNGKDTVVDSKNMETYVNLLIQHHYVTSIADQVTYFLEGFSDVITMSRLPSFFRCLSLEDFNLMLGGRSDISVEDWKAHIDYHGYEESDLQISWFWKIVESICIEQRKMLLFFWTSIKSLPLEGFVGLDSRLSIHKTSKFDDHLPSSHTCFYQLCFLVYQSMKDMEDRLKVITEGHIGSIFGTV